MVEPRDVKLLVQSQTVNFILYSFSRHLSGTTSVLGTVLAVGKYSSYFLGVFIEEGEIDTILSICCRSVAQSCLTLCNPWIAARQASLSTTNSWSLLKLMSIELLMPSNHLILFCPLVLLPSVFPSIRVFFFFLICSKFCHTLK